MSRIPIGKKTLPRAAAILIIYALFFTLVYLVLFAVVPQLYRELAHLSRSAVEFANSLSPEKIQHLAAAASRWLNDHGIPLGLSRPTGDEVEGTYSLSLDLEQVIRDATSQSAVTFRERMGDIVGLTQRIVAGILATIFSVFIILMIAAFISVDGEQIRAFGGSLVPREFAGDVQVLVARIDRSLSGVVRGQFTICLINGLLTLIGLLIFRVKFAFVLATLATLFSLIPIFGTIISSIPIVLFGLSQSFKTGLGMLLWILGIHALETYVLNPKIMGSAARIHPIVIAFALIAGERTLGIVGVLLAGPLAAILVACFEFARQKALLANRRANPMKV
jgi:predicted PurR-regulated permease PerM